MHNSHLDHPLTVVICDDEPIILLDTCDLVSEALDSRNIPHVIHEFSDGQSALEFVRARGHAHNLVILTDENMPRLHGIAMLGEMRKDGLMPSHAAIFSGTDHAVIADELAQHGIDSSVYLISKPAAMRAFEPFFDAIAGNRPSPRRPAARRLLSNVVWQNE